MAEPSEGLYCPDCGCPDTGVIRTTRFANWILRERRCKHCGRKFRTKELSILPRPHNDDDNS